jgi:RHS repeat-associated protein
MKRWRSIWAKTFPERRARRRRHWRATHKRTLTTQFAYNGDGVRTSKTVDGDSTEYALDLAATLPVVISDTDAVYLYGLDIIAQQQSERLYYVHDGLGSVRQLVDTTGWIETNYAYDPFGVPLVGGEVYHPYQYTGEAWDAEVELLYLRARYYQPEVGRFDTKDPWTADASEPLTLNRYVYAGDNPVNYTDPSGQTRRPPYDVFAPYPYDISALELGWLWLTEQCPEYMVFDERWALTRQLMHDQGVNQARIRFYQELHAGRLKSGRDYYGYQYLPISYIREAAEYLVGYDRVGFFLGSYGVYTRLNSDQRTVTFSVVDPKNLQSFTKSPCYFAPDRLGPIVNNPHLPESLQLERSVHSLEGLVMKTQQFAFPSDIFLVSLLEPRFRYEPGPFGSDVRIGGSIYLVFTWTEPLQTIQWRDQ